VFRHTDDVIVVFITVQLEFKTKITGDYFHIIKKKYYRAG